MLAVTSNDGIAALKRKLLRFFCFIYSLSCFIKVRPVVLYLACADAISTPSKDVTPFHTFFSFQAILKFYCYKHKQLGRLTYTPLILKTLTVPISDKVKKLS